MNASDVKNFVEGTATYYAKELFSPHIREQANLRAFLCGECLANGKCLICKCKTPHMFYAPAKVDKKGRWAEFLNKEQWEALKANIDQYSTFIKSLPNENDAVQGNSAQG